MRRVSSFVVGLAFALLLVVPAARPAVADSVCPTWDHFFASSVSFPAGFWTEGTHDITFAVDPYFSLTYVFQVDTAAPLYRGQVLMTPISETEISLLAANRTYLGAINPDQATVARDVVIGPIADLIWLKANTTETISWDGGDQMVETQVSGISSSCVYGGPDKTTISEWVRDYPPRVR